MQHLSSSPQSKTRANAVLARVSPGYPPPAGRLLTCYAPVRHWTAAEAPIPFDLHVLSAPPAFVLSQDQTLHELNSSFERTRLCSFGIFTFTSRYYSGREGRVAFGLLRHGAPVLALPKTRVVNFSRTADPLSFASGQFHPAAASVLQSITLDRLRQGAARGKFVAFRLASLLATPSI